MWLVASFDLPTKTSGAAKRYRVLRKALISGGFTAIQKSVFWRWCENDEHRRRVLKKILKAVPAGGDLLFFAVPDGAFSEGVHIADGEPKPFPEPPAPWAIFT